jgi:hypothetical protein
MNKIADATNDEIKEFLSATFEPVGDAQELQATKDTDMFRYARMARFLSDTPSFANVAAALSEDLEQMYTKYREEGLRGAFSQVLRDVAELYGFSSEVRILNGKVDPADFAEVVTGKILFRDVFTRPHGEFTHAVQWLTMACAFDFDVAESYKNSVRYRSNRNFNLGSSHKKIYIWNFLVDCFEANNENYKTNIFCETFRCPQYVTENLRQPTTNSWLGEFIYNRSLKHGTSHYQANMDVRMSKAHVAEREWGGKPVYEVLKASPYGAPQVMRKIALDERRADWLGKKLKKS